MNKNLINPDTPVFPISAAAQQLQIHQRTLRIYDDEKILCPKRTPKNRRLYSIDDIKKGEFIQYLTQKLGLNLAGVKITLELLEKLDISSLNYRDMIGEIVSKY